MKQVRFSAAVAKSAVVEYERCDALTGESLRKGPETVATRPGEAVRHHDDRHRRRPARGGIQPGGARIAGGSEAMIFTAHNDQTPGRART
jgi:hypothetical protein